MNTGWIEPEGGEGRSGIDGGFEAAAELRRAWEEAQRKGGEGRYVESLADEQSTTGERFVDFSGGTMAMSVERFARYEASGLSPEMFVRYEQIVEDARLVGEALGEGDLAKATGEALVQRADDMARVAREVREGRRVDVTAEEVERAQRDLMLVLGAMTVALGARDWQEGVENSTFVFFESGKSIGLGRYQYQYKTCFDSLEPMGDVEEEEFDEDTHYPGKLIITIDPMRRIDFSYVSDLPTAAKHYEQAMQIRKSSGEMKEWRVEDLSVRLDRDEHSPSGLSLDVGRHEYESDTLSRPGDVMGKVLVAASPSEGSHTSGPFRPEMQAEFANMAEYLIVHQDLVRRRVEDTGNAAMRMTPEEQEVYWAHKYGNYWDGIEGEPEMKV